MEKRSVRITRIEIYGFKNVIDGKLVLNNFNKDYNSSILGLYGQNGSGKTALIDAIALLKYVFCGMQIPVKYVDFINLDKKYARFSFQFNVSGESSNYDVWYEFSLGKVVDDTHVNMNEDEQKCRMKAEIFDEVLSYSYESKQDKIRKNTLIDTHTDSKTIAFLPKTKYNELLNGETDSDIIVTKRFVRATSRSFIFSGEMINKFNSKCKNQRNLDLINTLVVYGNKELFVINTENSGLISLNALPIAFKYKDKNAESFGNFMIPLNAPATVPNEAHELVLKLIENMNIVLDKLVPGLTIGVLHLSDIVLENGKVGKTIQLMSIRKGKQIPFQYESEGVKKIVSILQLLIVIYNNPSVTVAVDELDSGIFEYLLGEVLRIISEKGKGQLIFTSHNLRPLETIYKGFIAFTTTNPKNRYTRMTNVNANNNLRDFYYRDIVLGEQKEQLYDPTNNYEIALAFREAGDSFGS